MARRPTRPMPKTEQAVYLIDRGDRRGLFLLFNATGAFAVPVVSAAGASRAGQQGHCPGGEAPPC